MEILHGGFNVDLRKKDGIYTYILQTSMYGHLEHGGVKYDYRFSCVPVVTVLNIGYYINQLSNKMEKGHVWIGNNLSDGKYQRAPKEVLDEAKVVLYPYALEEMRTLFEDLNTVNVSE